MNSDFWSRLIAWVALLVSVSCHSPAFSQDDDFGVLIEDASEVIHIRLTAAVLMEEEHEGVAINCGVRYQAEIIEDFTGHSSGGGPISIRGGPMKVGSEYLVVLTASPQGVEASGRCRELWRDDLSIGVSYLISGASSPTRTHPNEKMIGYIGNLGDPFPDSVDLQQRDYKRCSSVDAEDWENCPIIKVETIFLWEDLANYLRRIEWSTQLAE